jgi:hypothetical protein
VQNGAEARLARHPDGDGGERFVLCRSDARAAKERAMLARQMDRLSDELLKVDRSLRRRPELDAGKIERRIGRWLGKYPAAATWLEAELIRDGEDRAWGLRLFCPLPEQGDIPCSPRELTCCAPIAPRPVPAKIWRWYIHLTQAEAAFRSTKPDIGLCLSAKPDEDVAILLVHLGLHLPKGSKLVQNVVEKNR